MLPLALADKWRHLPLPRWVGECCGLPSNSSVSDLAAVAAPGGDGARGALEFYVNELVRSHAEEIAEVLVFPPRIVDGTFIDVTHWPGRPRNLLARVGALSDPKILRSLTYGQLLSIKGAGAKTVVEVGLRAEQLAPGKLSEQPPEVESATPLTLDKVTLDSLRAFAAADWADFVYGSDPRFADLIPNNGRSLADLAAILIQIYESASGENSDPMRLQSPIPSRLQSPSDIQKWLGDVRDRTSRLDLLKLEDLLTDYLDRCSTLRGKRRDAILARLGWLGKPSITLEESGQLLGVTRERIRQIEHKLRQKFPSTPAYFPALSKALRLLADVAPIEVDKAALLLQTRGVSKAKFSPESVISAAIDLGLEPLIQVTSTKGVQIVARAANTTHVASIITTARRKAGASGVASAPDIAASVSLKSGLECSVEEATRTLDASRRFRRLPGSWYWATDLPIGRNRLVNLCTSMLSVTSPISIARLREGIKREYTFRNSSDRFDLRVPPAEVLRDFLRDHPDFVVDEHDSVRPTRPLDYRQELGPYDQAIVEVLRSSPSTVLDRATIIRECVARGVNPQSLNVDLTYSCLLEHIDTNIWTLRGSDVNPAAVEAVRQANALRPKEKRVREFGWTRNGCLWIAAVIPPITQPFVFGCPQGTRAYLAGQVFAGVMRDSTPCGKIRVTEEGNVHGFSVFQQISGCESGDIVVIEFNLTDQKATLLLGDEEFLDRYSS